jgi:multicomponent Na+:H+ antiporter subunit D
MCGLQRHIKRMLAYSTIAHAGCFLIGVALLSPDALGGAAVYVVAHGFAKGALFLAGGILLVTQGEIDELLLHGRGRGMRVTSIAWLVAAVALASPPFLGTFTGHALIEDTASALGYWWVPVVLAVATIGSSAAILRAGARVFLGAGDQDDPLLSKEPTESVSPEERSNVPVMAAVTLVLALAGLVVGALTGLAADAVDAAHGFTDRLSYAGAVLEHRASPPVAHMAWHTTTESVTWACITLAGSFLVGWLSLFRTRLPDSMTRVLAAALAPLRAAHSGHIGDYVAWLTFGTAVIGGLFALTIR